MNMKANDRYYLITLEHFGTPAYCSFDKQYAGTMEMLNSFIYTLEQRAEPDSYEQGIADAFHRYQEGYHDASTFIAQGERQLIHPATAYAIQGKLAEPFFYEHTNVWGFPYFIRADRMESELVYLRRGLKFMRYVKATLDKPLYGTEQEHCDSPLNGNFWGHPGILCYDNSKLSNQVMFCDRFFETEDEMRKDILAPADIDFTEFFSDVFGDG